MAEKNEKNNFQCCVMFYKKYLFSVETTDQQKK